MTHPLEKYTFAIRHNPNCPSTYQITTCGTAFWINENERRNFRSYGNSLTEAMDNAYAKIQAYERDKEMQKYWTHFTGIAL